MPAQTIRNELPLLRRYARALTGSQQRGDGLVRFTLEALLADENLLNRTLANSSMSSKGALFRLFHSVHPNLDVNNEGSTGDDASVLDAVSPQGRQIVLLTVMEGFNMAEAAAILGLDTDAAKAVHKQAMDEIDQATRSRVLIIEDEPLIAMQLEALVQDLGHDVVGNATTHTEAVAMHADHLPDLVLADIQLADGSSGIDAVQDILKSTSVPVIFITAFPERLLTGERPEPTFLINKPFEEEAVKIAIAQAIFFRRTNRADQ